MTSNCEKLSPPRVLQLLQMGRIFKTRNGVNVEKQIVGRSGYRVHGPTLREDAAPVFIYDIEERQKLLRLLFFIPRIYNNLSTLLKGTIPVRDCICDTIVHVPDSSHAGRCMYPHAHILGELYCSSAERLIHCVC